MTGHVFHPGHHALHGITVVVETSGTLTYVGRFDTEDERGVHLIGASLHDASVEPMPLPEFLRTTMEFGVKVDRPHLVVPSAQIRRISPLNELSSGLPDAV